MQVEVTTFDDSEQVEYTVPGKSVRVLTLPSETDESEVIVEVWDEAGCAAREARPADQAQRIALRTLFDEIKADEEETSGVVAEAV